MAPAFMPWGKNFTHKLFKMFKVFEMTLGPPEDNDDFPPVDGSGCQCWDVVMFVMSWCQDDSAHFFTMTQHIFFRFSIDDWLTIDDVHKLLCRFLKVTNRQIFWHWRDALDLRVTKRGQSLGSAHRIPQDRIYKIA